MALHTNQDVIYVVSIDACLDSYNYVATNWVFAILCNSNTTKHWVRGMAELSQVFWRKFIMSVNVSSDGCHI